MIAEATVVNTVTAAAAATAATAAASTTTVAIHKYVYTCIIYTYSLFSSIYAAKAMCKSIMKLSSLLCCLLYQYLIYSGLYLSTT